MGKISPADDQPPLAAPAPPAPSERLRVAAGFGIAWLDRDRTTVWCDEAAQRCFDLPAHAPLAALLDRVARADRRAVVEALAQAGEAPVQLDFGFAGANGALHRIRATLIAAPHACTALLADLTDDHEAYQALRRERDHLYHTVEINPQLPWIADETGRVLEFTERWLNLTGLSREEALGEGWARVVHPDDLVPVQTAIWTAITSGEPFDVRCRMTLGDGACRWMRARGFPRRDKRGRIIRWYGFTEDIHEHVLVEQAIRWNADHDALTRLPNRALFNRRLEGAVSGGMRHLGEVALLLIDVDNFKDVNDIMGHDAGDTLLRAFGVALAASLPADATIARIGGDEFAVLLDLAPGTPSIEQHCARLFDRLRAPMAIDGRNVECRVSVGAAFFPAHGVSPSELFKSADIALYEAKARGRGQLVRFEPAMKQVMQSRIAMIEVAREAAEKGWILPFYQAQVSLTEGTLVGFEALLRRRAPDGTICSPGSIAAAFDDLEVAEALGLAMIGRVIEDVARWREAGLAFHSVAINVSTAELRNEAFAERLVERLARARVPHHCITIEVTEGVFLGRAAETAIRTIRALDALGFTVSLDDFGTGFASLSHLRQIPVGELKIDRSFVSDIGSKREDRAIVSAIINLAASLNLKLIAEGIETPEQAERLIAMGAHHAQGFLYARPAAAETIPDLILGWDRQAVIEGRGQPPRASSAFAA